VDPLFHNSSTAFACSGQTYTLPWGETVSGSGVYADTIHYVNGCDSLIRQVSLSILPTILSDETASICAGQTYTLPWGDVVSSAGVYTDTLHYTNGCDSLISTVTVTVNSVQTNTIDATICSGSSYSLPSGLVVSDPGTYRDTLHYIAGCDSIIRVTNLTVNPLFVQNSDVAICAGASYVLPWGTSVSSSGIYRDTTRYVVSGCDSLIQKVNLTVLTTAVENTSASICSGQNYTLPWGTTVSSPGTYHDTLHYANGCDSVISTVELTLNNVETNTTNAIICSGSSYLLPTGVSVTAEGVYRDTLHYVSGCDSLIRITNLTVHQLLVENSSASICAGDNYTLPWGVVISASGTYRDTIRYASSGCDSLRRNIILTVQSPQSATINASICSGDAYVLPWRESVSAAGTYKDTLHYTTGCDSVYRTVNLDVKTATTQSTTASICSGQSYTLPWGPSVSVSGTYRDTLRYVAGCDSIIRSVTLTVFAPSFETSSVQICAGQSYTLPWGPSVNVSGSYHDTLYYLGGCDSVIKTINLTVHSNATYVNKDTSVCEGDVYNLPWGGQVGAAGTYRDTIRTSSGCDSIVWKVSLDVTPYPIVSVSKSNDINCNIGTARLNASGGFRYSWTPAGTLDNAQVRNPIASPTASTLYHVAVSSPEGCTVTDSIEVLVLKDPTQFGFQLPSAFTPNGDGLNDCFGLSGWGGVTDVRFYIYNRWGELVFFTTDPSKCWDGTFKGKALGNEVFIYQVYANSFCGKIYRNGTVAVIR
jgi:gliding motility-associated-like protein